MWKDWAAGLRCYFEPDPIVHPNGQCPERGTEQPNILAYGEGNSAWDHDKEQSDGVGAQVGEQVQSRGLGSSSTWG